MTRQIMDYSFFEEMSLTELMKLAASANKEEAPNAQLALGHRYYNGFNYTKALFWYHCVATNQEATPHQRSLALNNCAYTPYT